MVQSLLLGEGSFINEMVTYNQAVTSSPLPFFENLKESALVLENIPYFCLSLI